MYEIFHVLLQLVGTIKPWNILYPMFSFVFRIQFASHQNEFSLIIFLVNSRELITLTG